MGEALLRGFLRAGLYAPADVLLVGGSSARVREVAADTGAKVANSALEAAQQANVLLLAVKPGVIGTVLEQMKPSLTPKQVVISVAAGITVTKLQNFCGSGIPVVRVMPNTPSLVGVGASAYSLGTYSDEGHRQLTQKLFDAVGIALEVDEKVMDAVTGLSGSGPAYVFTFIEALADGGVKAGLPRATAMKLAAQTVLGAAQMVLETGEHPGALKDKVASPGGTTITGLHALEKGAFRGTVASAVEAAAKRSKEMN